MAETGVKNFEGVVWNGLSVAKAADIIWSTNSPEFYLLLVEQRGWSPKEFEDWLADAWILLLLNSGT